MATTAKIRDLRIHFPEIRELVESEGEVILTVKGEPRYRLSLYARERTAAPPTIDYWARLCSYQPAPITAEQARELDEHNRGDR
jgi:antitoxin (DNA-binding transcriptional repressor) of toxin-antitoxin stability system